MNTNMEYITGTYALNLFVEGDDTPGDWHFSALDWTKPRIRDTEDSIYKDWGIGVIVRPELSIDDNPLPGRYAANHIRACLDLIEEGYWSSAQGMREYFIGDDQYAQTIFDKVWLLKNSPQWKDIDAFMGREYLCQWLAYRRNKEDETNRY